jgi:hypothetical protein
MPFRELFVELSADVFAIAKAPFRPGPIGQVLDVANERPMSDWLMRRYGWRRFAISRCAYDGKVEISARLDCGHLIEYKPIDERALHLASNPAFAFIDALDKSVDDTARCYCVRRVRLDEEWG